MCEDFLGFAVSGQMRNALAEQQFHTRHFKAVWKEMCVSSRDREGGNGDTCFYGL